eukprot:XP_011407103.1 PREDICTED: uncharacterized protein LOC105314556 [Amphimedon queenslandica]
MAAAGGVHRLPRQIPWHAAMAVILAGKRLTAAQALSFGLVNEVVPSPSSSEGEGDGASKAVDGEEGASALMVAARRWAEDILAGAPLSVRASKEAVVMGAAMPLEHAIDSVFPIARRMYESQDLVEGPRAFAEKRKPNWQGR